MLSVSSLPALHFRETPCQLQGSTERHKREAKSPLCEKGNGKNKGLDVRFT